MSRIFTINFPFKEKNYTALVSYNSQECEHSCTVRYLDEDIDILIPGSRLRLSCSGCIEYPKLENKFARDLACKTTEAINCYLQLHQTTNLNHPS